MWGVAICDDSIILQVHSCQTLAKAKQAQVGKLAFLMMSVQGMFLLALRQGMCHNPLAPK